MAKNLHTKREAGSRRRVTIMGATGSVGRSTLDLISRQRGDFEIEALTAQNSVDGLIELALSLRPKQAVIGDAKHYSKLKKALEGSGVEAAAGAQALIEAAARPAEWVMAAIVGAAGLETTLTAIRRGAVVALANKECLVCAGELLLREAEASGATILPVDSEHNAIFQVFEADRPESVERIILTASGGPFLNMGLNEMARVTPAQAVAHPVWRMGEKISVDSATLMNKGLELIEASRLFAMPSEKIDVLVHPQSVIHSLVEYIDGSVLAQLGSPDMRTPIAFTLAWPNRMATPSPRLNLAEIMKLTFEAPDIIRFPALRLAREALQEGGAAPTILNAANEIAVAAFLAGRIGFLDIARVVEETLNQVPNRPVETLDTVREVDATARRAATELSGEAARRQGGGLAAARGAPV